MTSTSKASVCIVGAGSAGIITGYHLGLADVAVTYLVRPHGRERLSRPQILYSYDDQTLKTFSGYDVVADPDALRGRSFDFMFVTLDGASLRADAGRVLVESLGRAFRGTSTGVILASQGFDLRSWFLERSGLSDAQMTLGGIASFVYEVQATTLPLHPGVKPDLLAQADYGYRHYSTAGFLMDTSAPQVSRDFAALYDRNGQNVCNVVSTDEYTLPATTTCLVSALKLLGWPSIREVDPNGEEWRLGFEAMRELQRLSLYGEAGVAASEGTTAESTWTQFRQLEEATLPLDLVGFFRYHHGGKLGDQSDRAVRDGLAFGEAEGLAMPALRTLIERTSAL